MPLEMRDPRPPELAELPSIPAGYINPTTKLVAFIDAATGKVKSAPPVDVREMLACGAAKLPGKAPYLDDASASISSEAPGDAPTLRDAQSPGAPPSDAVEAIDLDECTVVQLRDIARDVGVKGYSTLDKAGLIEALRAQD